MQELLRATVPCITYYDSWHMGEGLARKTMRVSPGTPVNRGYLPTRSRCRTSLRRNHRERRGPVGWSPLEHPCQLDAQGLKVRSSRP